MTAVADPAADAPPLTTGDLNTVLSRLSALGLTHIADWIRGDPEVAEWREVEELCRDVLALSPFDLGYGEPDKPRTVAARRAATRTALLIEWATDPWYADTHAAAAPDDGPHE